MTKALVLFSGGLDSMLAAKTLMNQGIEVIGLTFNSYFFRSKKARQSAQQLGIKLKEIDFSDEHLAMVKNPKYGYGKNMNPCIDCHSLMLREARKIMDDEGYDFIASGEVLGQRPMSQNKEALETIAKYSGVGEKLVRPLSAKLLEITEPEKTSKIIRGKLLNISGRARDKQMELVKRYGIKEYASPGSGCLLTDPMFSTRLIKMFDYWSDCQGNDVELLKYGRVFWINMIESKALIVIGRHSDDNEKLEKLAKKGDIMLELKEIAGPITVIRKQSVQPETCNMKYEIGNRDMELEIPEKLKKSELGLGEEKTGKEIMQIAGLLTGWYATKARGKKVLINLRFKN